MTYSRDPMLASSPTRIVILSLLLVTVTLAFYNPITRNQFIDFDDGNYIVMNSHIQNGLTWDTIKWSFTTFQEGNWHPLTWLSHTLDYQLFHLDPVGHHYVNLILHVLNAVLLFLLLWRATGLTWPSLAVAALFALHPVNVESVAWAAERKNVLSTLFFFLALHAYDGYARTGRRSLYWAVNVCFALGLMAKPQVVTLPFVLLLWDYWPLQRLAPDSSESESPSAKPRSFSYLLLEKLPLFVLAAVASVVTIIAQRAGNAVRTVNEVSSSSRLQNVFVSYLRYIGKMVWPSRLAALYPRPARALPDWQVLGAVSLLLLFSALMLRSDHKRYRLFGWIWFLGTLVPMIGIITVGEQSMADRYAYIPFIGLFIAIVWTLNDWFKNAQTLQFRNIFAVTAASTIAVFGCLTYRQIHYWHDEETIWRYTLLVTDQNYTAHNNLALALARHERSEEAVAEFRAATALHKYPPSQVLALAVYEIRVGHPKEAMEACNSVLQAADQSSDPKLKSAAWDDLGLAHLQLHEYDKAAESYRNTLRLAPEDEKALIISGMLALRQEQSGEAVTQLSHAVKVDPSNVNLLLLARALHSAGRDKEADSAVAEAQKISPNLNQAEMAAGQLLAVANVATH